MRIKGIDIVHWNPKLPVAQGVLASLIRRQKRVDNFGDLLGPIIVNRILSASNKTGPFRDNRLLSVGSILHFAKNHDVVWGSGINGKISLHKDQIPELDIRLTRGPLTAAKLRESGNLVPDIYGDPGLLIPVLFPETKSWVLNKKCRRLYVPNLNDFDNWKAVAGSQVLDPRANVWDCIRAICQSEIVVASSLHALVIADAFGVPTIPVKSGVESSFKYEDYYLGTGREVPTFVPNIELALKHNEYLVPQSVDGHYLLDSFPWDLWK